MTLKPLVFGDSNFPADSIARNCPGGIIRCDGIQFLTSWIVLFLLGHNIPRLLNGVLKLFPLDSYVDHPVCLFPR